MVTQLLVPELMLSLDLYTFQRFIEFLVDVEVPVRICLTNVTLDFFLLYEYDALSSDRQQCDC